MKILSLVALVAIGLTACYAEGKSLAVGATRKDHFLTINRCEAEATRTLTPGVPKHTSFVCEAKLLGLTLEQREYVDGGLIICAEPAAGGP